MFCLQGSGSVGGCRRFCCRITLCDRRLRNGRKPPGTIPGWP
ncbi:hypothetical protein N9M16_09755 [Candidatus Dependentiae bacterium]|nr:hypothetical protein [Candidatus Dependentiae bacterium]